MKEEIPDEIKVQVELMRHVVDMIADKWVELALEECTLDNEAIQADEAAAVEALKQIKAIPELAQGQMLSSFMGARPFLTSFLGVIGNVLETTGYTKGIRGWSVVCHGDEGSAIFARITRNGDPDATAPVGSIMERKL